MATQNEDGTWTLSEDEARTVAERLQAPKQAPEGHLTPEQAADLSPHEMEALKRKIRAGK